MTREELKMRVLVRESDVVDRTDGSELAKAFNHLWEKYVEQESSDDAISRQAVLEVVNNPLNIRLDKIIENLPPVTPQPKTGHWTRELIRNEKGGCIGAKMICSRCGNDNKHDEYMNHCPNCGAKMVESQERSE